MLEWKYPFSTCGDPGIFVRGGGVQVSPTKKALTTFFFFFSPQLILQKSNGQFQRNLSFPKVPEGVKHFPRGGGVQLFPGVGVVGSNCLFPTETHITCVFQGGGPDPPAPPSGSALVVPIFVLLAQYTLDRYRSICSAIKCPFEITADDYFVTSNGAVYDAIQAAYIVLRIMGY